MKTKTVRVDPEQLRTLGKVLGLCNDLDPVPCTAIMCYLITRIPMLVAIENRLATMDPQAVTPVQPSVPSFQPANGYDAIMAAINKS